MKLLRIDSRERLEQFRRDHNIPVNWHEPDQVGITAKVSGHTLDNAGFWGQNGASADFPSVYLELWVTICKKSESGEDIPLAEVNLATLLSWACGYEEEPRRATGRTTTARPGSQEASDAYRSRRNRLRGGD